MASIAAQIARLEEAMAETQRQLDRAERREANARADSLQRADKARELTSRENLMAVQATARSYQERADSALASWGLRARAPVLGENLDAYRRDLLIQCKKQLPDDAELRRVQIRALPSDALSVMEPQILDACRKAAMRPDSVPEGTLRRVEKTDANGLKIIEWIGTHNFVRDFTTPVIHPQ